MLSKRFALLLIFVLFVFGMFLVESSVAPVTTPANPILGPEVVSVVINNTPEVFPPQYTTDPYTGQTQQSYPGHTWPSGTVTITIKNSPFTPYTDKNGNIINIYYAIFMNGSEVNYGRTIEPYCIYKSDSAHIDIVLTYGFNEQSTQKHIGIFMNGGSVDFRIQAVTGYFKIGYEESTPGFDIAYTGSVFEGEGSAFTEFTITIPSRYDASGTSKPNLQAPSPSYNGNPPPTPSNGSPQNKTQPSLTIILIVVCIIVLPVVFVVYFSRQRKTSALMDIVRVVCERESYS